jgi:hypothetical protein
MNSIFDRLEQGLEWSFSGLGLTEGQEQSMWDIVRPLAAEASKLYDQGLELDSELTDALETLSQSLEESGALGKAT